MTSELQSNCGKCGLAVYSTNGNEVCHCGLAVPSGRAAAQADLNPPILGKWRDSAVSKRHWQCLDSVDLGCGPENHELCEMCEKEMIRYVHVMHHKTYPEPLRVGVICAGHMEGSADSAEQRDRTMRNAAARNARTDAWEPDWRRSAAGNVWFKERGLSGTVYTDRKLGGFRYVLNDPDGKAQFSSSRYTNRDGAADACVLAARALLKADAT